MRTSRVFPWGPHLTTHREHLVYSYRCQKKKIHIRIDIYWNVYTYVNIFFWQLGLLSLLFSADGPRENLFIWKIIPVRFFSSGSLSPAVISTAESNRFAIYQVSHPPTIPCGVPCVALQCAVVSRSVSLNGAQLLQPTRREKEIQVAGLRDEGCLPHASVTARWGNRYRDSEFETIPPEHKKGLPRADCFNTASCCISTILFSLLRDSQCKSDSRACNVQI